MNLATAQLPSARASVAARAARAARRRRRGFTLIELTVALVAGLLVAMALVQVSKEANNTFHEEVRAAAAEMALRITLDRLRTDLQRVSYMSTGNIQRDPNIARYFGNGSNVGNVITPVPAIPRLAGVKLNLSGSLGNTPLSADPNNALTPDSIELGGNYSSTDEFVGFMCPGPTGGGGCGGQTICLEWNTPAMWRVRNTGANAAQTLQSYFNPSFYTNPSGAGVTRFMARVQDDTGHYVYVLTCGGAATTNFGATGASVSIDPATVVLTTANTRGHGGVAGLGAGRVIINPVEIVHWELNTWHGLPASAGNYTYGATPNGGTADQNEYILTRSYVDAMTNLPDAATTEVIAEYAVDLKFAFTVDSQIPANTPSGAYTANPLLYIPLDSITNGAWAPDVSAGPPSSQGPHRIRSVRVRTAIRSAFADRTANVVPVPNTGQPYMYRYFIPGTANGLQWARVRTGVAEASLPNQARLYW